MSSELEDVQSQIRADIRKIYTDTVIDHITNPRNVGSIPDEDGFGDIAGSCGDTMEIWLKVKDGKIQNATFWTDGCGATVATGSMITELAKGKGIAEAQRITKQDVLDALGGLPEGNIHCAQQAAITLRLAIQDYMVLKREPWKKAYRRC